MSLVENLKDMIGSIDDISKMKKKVEMSFMRGSDLCS